MNGYLDASILNNHYIIYENLYFVYDKTEIDELIIVIINNLIQHTDYKKFDNDIIKYINDEYHLLKSKSKIVNDTEFIIENIIIPKYYDELQTKQNIKKFNTTVLKKEIVQDEINININKKPKQNKKKSIPLTLKRKVWNKYIGEEIGKTLCLCCRLSEITQLNFSCGHIISEFNGGKIKLDNLKPICISCNSSMGTKNMITFIDEYGL